MYKVIIAGGRDFNDFIKLCMVSDHMLSRQESIEIVSGGARGADSLGEMYALAKGYSLKKFPADWGKYGKIAGHVRNKDMAEYADALIAFWDGESRGTKHMIDTARRLGLKVRVEMY